MAGGKIVSFELFSFVGSLVGVFSSLDTQMEGNFLAPWSFIDYIGFLELHVNLLELQIWSELSTASAKF